MKRIMALVALVSVVALFAFTTQAAAQDGPSLSADPPTVAAEGEHSFTVSGAGFSPGISLFVLPCTIPGDPVSVSTPLPELAAALGSITVADCNMSSLTPVAAGDDGSFSVSVTGTVGANFAWIAGDAAQSEVAAVPVFIVDPSMMDDMGDDMAPEGETDTGEAPEGGAGTGFGGMAGSDGNSVAVPLAASIAAVVALGGATLVRRRNT